MSDTVLFVDDEEKVLNSINRLFSESDVDILYATSADEALDYFSRKEIAVIVSDNQMPDMRGLDLLSEIRKISPDTLKILMTAYADLTVAVDAINNREVYRFIMKPWDNNDLLHVVREAVQRYKIIQSLKKDDESILLSLAQTIELKDRYTRGHCESVANYAQMITGALRLPDETSREIKFSSWLHDCGKIGVSESILNKNGPLDEDEFEVIKNHPRWGADVVRQARMTENIVKAILHHHEKYDGSGYPHGIAGHAIPLAARIVTVADVFDALTTDRPYRKKFTDEKSIEIMLMMEGNALDPELVDIFIYDCLKAKR